MIGQFPLINWKCNSEQHIRFINKKTANMVLGIKSVPKSFKNYETGEPVNEKKGIIQKIVEHWIWRSLSGI